MFHVKRVLREEEGEGSPGGAAVETKPEPQDDGRLDRLAAKLDEQGEAMRSFFAGLQQHQAPRQAPQVDDDQRRKAAEEFFNDPLTHTQRIAAMTAQQLQQQREMQEWPQKVEQAKDKVRGTDAKIFDRYADEIQKYVQQYDQMHWTNPETWKQALNAAKVAHFDDIVEEKRKLAERDHDGPGVPGPKGQPKPKEAELTDEELTMAAKLRLTPEEYKKGKALREKDQRDPTTGYDITGSVWGEAITFDSDFKRRQEMKRAS